MLRKLEWQIPG